MFLVVQDKKGGETKPFLIPDFVSIANYDGSVEDEQEIGRQGLFYVSPEASQNEKYFITMWVVANARIMHKLTNTVT